MRSSIRAPTPRSTPSWPNARPEREAFIEKMVSEVSGILSDAGIDAEVSGRPKHQYSIYRKMMEQNRPFEDIHDLMGIRVITVSTRDCYAALGLIHSHWVPVAGRFKDYIAMPKINLYQSLHTTVIGSGRQAVGGPDPHRGDASAGGGRDRRSLAVQGRGDEPGPQCRRRGLERRRGPRGVPGQPQARPLSGRGDRADSRG